MVETPIGVGASQACGEYIGEMPLGRAVARDPRQVEHDEGERSPAAVAAGALVVKQTEQRLPRVESARVAVA